MLYSGAQEVFINRIVLDWEAAYSDDYDIQIWFEPIEQWVSIFTMRPVKAILKKRLQRNDDNSTTSSGKFDVNGGVVTTTEWGQSPGVTFPTPLHILHDITLDAPMAPSAQLNRKTISSKMRLVIHTSATGWGVSLWQVQVYGHYVLPNK